MTNSIIQKSQLEGAQRIDAEYYQPVFMQNAKRLEVFGYTDLQNYSLIDITKGETPLWRGDDYLHNGIPFLRSENLISSGISLNNLVFISPAVHERMKRSKIYPNDILIAIVGATIGQAGQVDESFQEYNSNQAIAIIRPENKIFSHFLSIILESQLCQLQIERLKGGGSRDNLDLHEVKVIKIPKPSKAMIDICNDSVGQVHVLKQKSTKFYQKAEKLLLEEIGLNDLEVQNNIFSIVIFSEIKKANRIDAEYFQSKFHKLFDIIKKHNPKKLGDLVSMKKGFEPGSETYQEEGKLFVRVSNLSRDGLVNGDQKYLTEGFYQRLKGNFQPQINEILLTKDATPGIAYVLKEQIEGIISGGILRLNTKSNIDSEYLALVINSIVGKYQAERDAGGSIIAHWKPEEIKNILIPILPQSIQQKIAGLVRQSYTARQKSKELLEEAKMKVEEMIEKGGEKKWLKSGVQIVKKELSD